MVILTLNRPEYRNDVGEVIRLFLGDAEIVPDGDASDDSLLLTAAVAENDGSFLGTASARGETASCSLPDPNGGALDRKRIEKRVLKIAVFHLFQKLYPDTPVPWGSLTGIRPTKLFRELSQKDGEAAAREQFLRVFDVSEEKTRLAETICRVQTPYINTASEDFIDIYAGIPFCRTRCLFCSFGSLIAKTTGTLDEYLDTLFADISGGAALVKDLGKRVRAMYVGGGTPTVLSAEQLERLLNHLLNEYGTFGTEWTVEAGRPDTITREKLAVMRRLGVTRISVNPQTMCDETLRRIGRAHTVEDTVRAYMLARDMGFSSINMDLIVGLPGEMLSDVENTLSQVAALKPDHMTVHTLAVKRSSRLHERIAEYPMPSAETADAMVRAGRDAAAAMGLEPYYMYRQKYMQGNLENVGYALPGTACVYNIDIMEETTSILAHGAGAMTKRVFGGENRIERIPNPKNVPTYREKLPQLLVAKKQLFSD